MAPNRIAVTVGIVASAAAAAASVAAGADWQSVAGAAVGLAGIVKVLDRYLIGWQAYESEVHPRVAELEEELAAIGAALSELQGRGVVALPGLQAQHVDPGAGPMDPQGPTASS